jgi:hypothetical protein
MSAHQYIAYFAVALAVAAFFVELKTGQLKFRHLAITSVMFAAVISALVPDHSEPQISERDKSFKPVSAAPDKAKTLAVSKSVAMPVAIERTSANGEVQQGQAQHTIAYRKIKLFGPVANDAGFSRDVDDLMTQVEQANWQYAEKGAKSLVSRLSGQSTQKSKALLAVVDYVWGVAQVEQGLTTRAAITFTRAIDEMKSANFAALDILRVEIDRASALHATGTGQTQLSGSSVQTLNQNRSANLHELALYHRVRSIESATDGALQTAKIFEDEAFRVARELGSTDKVKSQQLLNFLSRWAHR